MVNSTTVAGGRDADPRRVYLPRNISLYRRLLTDRNITDGQRDRIGKMKAAEEAKLIELCSSQVAPALVPDR
jgi:hypothetical protein